MSGLRVPKRELSFENIELNMNESEGVCVWLMEAEFSFEKFNYAG